VVKPLGDARPAWKVLRVLANLIGLPGFEFGSSEEVLGQVAGLTLADRSCVSGELLNNTSSQDEIDLLPAVNDSVVARIYALDSLVRRAASLQMTTDAKCTELAQEVAA
jgi:NADH-quinone oxidoreductase subunit G